MVGLINKQLLLTAYAYLFITEQQKAQQGSEALQVETIGEWNKKDKVLLDNIATGITPNKNKNSVYELQEKELADVVMLKIPKEGNPLPAHVNEMQCHVKALRAAPANVVPIVAYGEKPQYLATKKMNPGDMETWMGEWTGTDEERVRVAADFCSQMTGALKALYDKAGLLRRDVKPGNIFVAETGGKNDLEEQGPSGQDPEDAAEQGSFVVAFNVLLGMGCGYPIPMSFPTRMIVSDITQQVEQKVKQKVGGEVKHYVCNNKPHIWDGIAEGPEFFRCDSSVVTLVLAKAGQQPEFEEWLKTATLDDFQDAKKSWAQGVPVPEKLDERNLAKVKDWYRDLATEEQKVILSSFKLTKLFKQILAPFPDQGKNYFQGKWNEAGTQQSEMQKVFTEMAEGQKRCKCCSLDADFEDGACLVCEGEDFEFGVDGLFKQLGVPLGTEQFQKLTKDAQKLTAALEATKLPEGAPEKDVVLLKKKVEVIQRLATGIVWKMCKFDATLERNVASLLRKADKLTEEHVRLAMADGGKRKRIMQLLDEAQKKAEKAKSKAPEFAALLKTCLNSAKREALNLKYDLEGNLNGYVDEMNKFEDLMNEGNLGRFADLPPLGSLEFFLCVDEIVRMILVGRETSSHHLFGKRGSWQGAQNGKSDAENALTTLVNMLSTFSEVAAKKSAPTDAVEEVVLGSLLQAAKSLLGTWEEFPFSYQSLRSHVHVPTKENGSIFSEFFEWKHSEYSEYFEWKLSGSRGNAEGKEKMSPQGKEAFSKEDELELWEKYFKAEKERKKEESWKSLEEDEDYNGKKRSPEEKIEWIQDKTMDDILLYFSNTRGLDPPKHEGKLRKDHTRKFDLLLPQHPGAVFGYGGVNGASEQCQEDTIMLLRTLSWKDKKLLMKNVASKCAEILTMPKFADAKTFLNAVFLLANELWYAHPLPEGDTRFVRVFVNALLLAKGYPPYHAITSRSGFLWYLPAHVEGEEPAKQQAAKQQAGEAGDYMVADYLVSVAYQSWRLENRDFTGTAEKFPLALSDYNPTSDARLGQFSNPILSKLQKKLNFWWEKFGIDKSVALTTRMKQYGLE